MEYVVVFLNYDGEELYRTNVKEGDTAVYNGPVPKKQGEEFVGWDKPLKNINSDLTIKAVFEKSKNGSLKLGAMSFVENDKTIHVIEQAVISNEDLHKTKETDIER